MTPSARPYAGERIVFATMHGKEALARAPFHDILGARIIAPDHLDTDQFGTFSGEIPRTLAPRTAARVKAQLGIHLARTPYAIASEGSFSSGFGPVVEHDEILLFLDASRGLELLESTRLTSPLPAGRRVSSVDAALAYAAAVEFPHQGVIVRGGTDQHLIATSLSSTAELRRKVTDLLELAPQVTLEPDYRAHRCPRRAAVIRTLATQMAERLDTGCPACDTPGFGRIDVERGLPCDECALPTHVIAADILGCGLCTHTERRARPERTAAAHWCDGCNP
jgi:hypothetical protein